MIKIPQGFQPALVQFRSVFSGSDLDRSLAGLLLVKLFSDRFWVD